MNLVSVILAGGSGERFWPLSRQDRPKQFLTLEPGNRSLIQATHDRLAPVSKEVFVVSNRDHAQQVRQHLPQMPDDHLWLEPVARDTAPAILLAALRIAARQGEDTIMGVFPSDHRIANEAFFRGAVQYAAELARTHEAIVTLGITPTHPSTAYGYIELGNPVTMAFEVERFVEKPDLECATLFVQSGEYLWNAGMFVFSVRTILNAYRRHAPDMINALEAVMHDQHSFDAAFCALEKKSFDYLIMEHARNVLVIPVSCGWDDLGDWNALERLHRGEANNLDFGQHVAFDTQGAIVYADGNELVVSIGLEDVLVVRCQNVTLVARKDRSQDIKTVVRQLKHSAQYAQFI
ncbi:MAG: mannose-1-phosphate guanylyltransferase [Pleurocapsa sp. SU_196_0]|nr:mannose-1-phosphate guanylyltransferase [Pleurocapsa sp. SU_196_0]